MSETPDRALRCVGKPCENRPKVSHLFFHHDRGFHLSERGKRERELGRGRVCDGNSAPPETKKKRAKMKNRRRDRRCEITPPWHLANKRSFECVCVTSQTNKPSLTVKHTWKKALQHQCNPIFFPSCLVAYRHLRMALPRSRLNPGR